MQEKLFSIVANISLRPEIFCWLVFIPASGEIIQLNSCAYKLLEEIVEQKHLLVNSDLDFWRNLEALEIVKEMI